MKIVSQRIVTLTLNPTVDGSANAETIWPLRKIRTSQERYDAGGGGINVARVVDALGAAATALYLAGGATGSLLETLLGSTGIEGRRVPIDGDTRIAHAVFERSSGLEYRFVPEGPEVSDEEWRTCRSVLADLPWDYLVASGSLPRGVPVDAYAQLAEISRIRGARLIVDTSGEALRAALQSGVYLVKPSIGELEALLGHALDDERLQEEAARELVENGSAKIVAVSLGRDGALLMTDELTRRLKPPPVEARSAVGAGDSFVAAMTLALAQDWPVRSAFAYGVAAGTAAVLSPGAELVRRDDVERLYDQLTSSEDTALHATSST